MAHAVSIERLEELEQEMRSLARKNERQEAKIKKLKSELARHQELDARSIDVAFVHASPKWVESANKRNYQVKLLDFDRERKGIKHAI